MGDSLTFDGGGSPFSAKVTSIRKVDWDSFKPNFFVIGTPALLKSHPASWITSFHLPQGSEEVIGGLVQRSVSDLTGSEQVQVLIQQVVEQQSTGLLEEMVVGQVVFATPSVMPTDPLYFPLTPAQTWVRYGGPDAAPVTTDGPHPETSDLIAGWFMIDVESRERALELAAYVSSEPGPRGELGAPRVDRRFAAAAAASASKK